MPNNSQKTQRPDVAAFAASLLREEVEAAPSDEAREAAACASRVALKAAERMYEVTFQRVYAQVLGELNAITAELSA